MSNILIFGDSIARGAIDLNRGGWTQRLNIFLWQDNFAKTGSYYKGPEAYIFAMDGDVTSDIIKRLDNNIKSMPWQKEIIIFAVGLNDSGFNNGQKRTTKKQFKINIKILIEKAQKIVNKNNIYFVGITDIDTYIVKHDFIQNRINEFNKILNDIVEENDCKVISMKDVLNKEDFADGYHPNAQGHKKMFERIKDFLIENNIV